MAATRHLVEDTRGFIVVAVLWILAALSAAVLIYMTFVTNAAVIVSGGTSRVQTQAAMTAAVELAASRLGALKEPERPGSGAFGARIGQAQTSISFRSEAARIDLNAAPKQLLSGLFVSLGATPFSAESYADRIIGWRTPSAATGDDLESAVYRTAGVSFLPRHGPFPLVEELWLVHGIPPVFVERALPYLTVFSGQPSISALDAAPQAVAALPGMTPEKLQAILAARGDPRNDPRDVLGLTGADVAPAGARTYRVGINAVFDNGRQASAEVVILLLDDGDDPYRILFWRDGLGGEQGTLPRQAGTR